MQYWWRSNVSLIACSSSYISSDRFISDWFLFDEHTVHSQLPEHIIGVNHNCHHKHIIKCQNSCFSLSTLGRAVLNHASQRQLVMYRCGHWYITSSLPSEDKPASIVANANSPSKYKIQMHTRPPCHSVPMKLLAHNFPSWLRATTV